MHIRWKLKMHIRDRSVDKLPKKTQTHKLKQNIYKTSHIFNKASKFRVFLLGRKESIETPIICCLRDYESSF